MQATAVKQDFKSVLRKAPQKEASATKAKTPVINATEEIRTKAERFREEKEALDKHQQAVDLLAEELVSECSPYRLEMLQREYVPTIRVPSADGLSITITWSSNYKKISTEQEQELLQILGETAYSEYFKSKFVISAVDLSNDQLSQFFYWLSPKKGEREYSANEEDNLAIGQERFFSMFKVEEIIKPTERFVREHPLMGVNVQNSLKLAGVAQYKPSVKSK